MPALPPYTIGPVRGRLVALPPRREASRPLGCHRPRLPDGVVFERPVRVPVSGCAYGKVADEGCSATAPPRRRDGRTLAGLIGAPRGMALDAHDRMVGPGLSEAAAAAAGRCLAKKAPCGG